MKTKITVLALLLMTCVIAQGAVKFSFDIRTCPLNQSLQKKVEKNISLVLDRIQNAALNGKTINFGGVEIEPEAKNKLLRLYEMIPFSIDSEEEIIEKCLIDHQGYQIRNIPVIVHPKKSTEYTGEINRSLTISFNKNGIITGINLALAEQGDIRKFYENSQEVSDAAQRLEILKWVEDYCNYYNEKDIKSIEQVFSDNALIITGSVTWEKTQTDLGGKIAPKTQLKKQTKTEYINNLEKIFKNKKYIDVKFEDIKLERHGLKPYLYGVTLRQKWTSGNSKNMSNNYHDEGWLFLLWDFSDREHPKIHVRTWQNDEHAEREQVFSFNDFILD